MSSPSPPDQANLAWRIANLRRFDLNLLLSLHALLHTRNVTQAGDWLGVTQPAMSSDLRRLRQMAGLKLLEPPLPIPDVAESMYWSAAVDRDPGHVWLRNLMRDIASALCA